LADIYEVMRCSPSTRRFTDEPVSREVISRVLDNARFAPSGGNRQGWRAIVVTDADVRRRLRELYVPAWETYTEGMGVRALLDPGADVPPGVPARRVRMLRNADHFARTFDSVPVHLVMCVDVDLLAIVDSELGRPPITGGGSIYPFVQNVLLALRAEGLGAAITTLLARVEPAVRELLGMPDNVALACHISTGHRAEPWPSRLSRNPVESFAFAERYGQPWTG
jgi:nitroreductase